VDLFVIYLWCGILERVEGLQSDSDYPILVVERCRSKLKTAGEKRSEAT